MRGSAHTIISAWLCQAFAIVFFGDLTPIPFVIGAFCGLIADIDEPQSKISYMLIKQFGGKKKIGGVNNRTTDEKHNKKIKQRRQVALTVVLVMIAAGLLFLSTKNIFFSAACLYVSYLPWTTHRSLSHSLLSSVVFGLCMTLSFNMYGVYKYGVYCGIGYFLHIFEDSFTMSGVPLLYPFSKKRYKLPLMSTGTKKGAFVEFLFMSISLIICAALYFAKLR